MSVRTRSLALVLLVSVLATIAFIWWWQRRAPGPDAAPVLIEARFLKKSELTAAEVRYGRAPLRHPSVTYEDDVVIVDGGADVIRSVTPDGLVWTIDARAHHASDLSVGKIAFVTGRCMGRVLFLERDGDNLRLIVGPVDLTDVFRKLEVRINQPIDLSEVIEVPPPRFEGVKFPLEGADAAQPEWSVAPIVLAPAGRASARDTFFARPITFRPGEAQVSPVTPGIPQRLNLDFQTQPLVNADGIGAELKSDRQGIIVIAQAQIRAPKPHLKFHLSIDNKKVDAELVLQNAVGFRLAFDGSASEAFSGNANWSASAPGFSIPVAAGPVPLEVSVRHEVWVQTAFSARQSAFTAGGDYSMNVDIGFTLKNGKATFVGPKGLTVKKSLMKNMDTISIGPTGVVISHVATMTAGLGAWGFTTGPTFGLATSVAVAQGPSIALIQCQGATLAMKVRGGFGWTIPEAVAKLINAVLSIFHVRIPDHGSVDTPFHELFRQHAQTESKVCGGPGT